MPTVKQNKVVFFENLDALRALAFGMVFIYHFFGYMHYTPSTKAESLFVTHFIMEGHLGVNVFFVLSGFLITYLLLSEKETTGRIHVGFFYMRRILRIWPLYFAVLVIGFFIYPLLTGQYDSSVIKDHLSYYALFIGNFDRIRSDFVGIGNDNLGVLWSIAVEEQFYFFWPLILLLINKKHHVPVFLLIIGASLTYRAFHYKDATRIYLHSLSVMSDLIVGALLATISLHKTKLYYRLENCSSFFIAGVYVLLLMAILFFHYWSRQNAFTVVTERLILSMFFAFVIGEQCFAKNSLVKLGRFKRLNFIGVISYGLYSLHLYSLILIQKINLMFQFDSDNKLVFYCELAISLALSIFLCYFSYHYFEKNILKLKSKFTPVNPS